MDSPTFQGTLTGSKVHCMHHLSQLPNCACCCFMQLQVLSLRKTGNMMKPAVLSLLSLISMSAAAAGAEVSCSAFVHMSNTRPTSCTALGVYAHAAIGAVTVISVIVISAFSWLQHVLTSRYARQSYEISTRNCVSKSVFV